MKAGTRAVVRVLSRGIGAGVTALAAQVGTSLVADVAGEISRVIKEHVMNTLTSKISVVLEDDAIAYSVLSQWVLQNCASAAANVLVHTPSSESGLDDYNKVQLGVGSYYFRVRLGKRKHYVRAEVTAEERLTTSIAQYRLDLVVYGDKKRKVIAHLRNLVENVQTGRQKVLSAGEYSHLRTGFIAQRSFDSVILKPEIEAKLRRHLQWFTRSRAFFVKHGLAYKTTILLHGPPGTGKTSLCRAIAHELGYAIVIVKLSKLHTLNEITIPSNSLILIEDIDKGVQTTADAAEVEIESSKEITRTEKDVWLARSMAQKEAKRTADELEGMRLLMQMLDGIQSPNNVVFVMTTNHPELLTAEFDRAGRVNLKLLIGYFDMAESLRLGAMYNVPKSAILELPEEVRTNPAMLHEFVLTMPTNTTNHIIQ